MLVLLLFFCVGIDYGVYGVPETFVIDRDGVIRYKQIGPVTDDDTTVNLQGRQGEVVLLWITDLGDPKPGEDLPFSVRIADARIISQQS